jgi:hypothetical protein
VKLKTQNFLHQLSRSPETKQAAVADNCRFDERVASGRWTKFEAYLPENPDVKDWGAANQHHYESNVIALSSSVPDSFLNINQSALLPNIATNREVVRMEDLRRFFEKGNLNFQTLQNLLDNRDKTKDADQLALLATKIDVWNQNRDARPVFFAFYDEVLAEADHADWQHQLRDRLGLGFYPYPSDDENTLIPVALMRYSLDEVKKPHDGFSPFALPTVLDGGMHEYFFPVPQSHPYGATVHLVPDQAEQLTAEILHYRFDYQPEHLWKIAWITRPHNLKDDALRTARDLHLLSLQVETGHDGFGEPMVGRI